MVFLLAVALLPEPLDPTYRSVANPLGPPGGLPVEVPLLVVNLLAGAVVLLTVPVACVSLVARFRRARGLERQTPEGAVISLLSTRSGRRPGSPG